MEKKAKMTESAKSLWKGRYGVLRKAETKKGSSSSSTDEEETDGEPRTSKRVRSQYQPFQSPEALAVLAPALYKPPTKPCSISKSNDDKIVVFSKGDFLAVRNEEGTFFVCRTAQNVYKSSRKFKIQWLNDEKEPGIYIPDFYDTTDFECVLTNLKMNRKDKTKYQLPADERKRTMNILERAINVQKGLTEVPDPRKVVSDGVDVSIVGREEEEELIKISPKPTIKIAKEKPAKVCSARSKRSSTNGERDVSLRERRRSTETNHKATPSTSVKRERRASNPAPETPVSEDRRSTRSSSRTVKEEKKPPPPPTPSTSAIKSTPSIRKRRMSNNDQSSSKETVKSEVRSSRSHVDRSNHSEKVRQPTSMRIVNMNAHEAKRPKIRISLTPNLKVPEMERELTFESRDEIPEVSSLVDSKLLIRAVNRKDYELIDKMVLEGKVCSFCVPRSLNIRRDALSYAIQKEDLSAIKMLMDKKYLARLVSFPDVLITRSPGKKQNILILGQANSTPEAMEVLLQDLSHNYDYRCLRQRTYLNSEIIKEALKFGISVETIDKFCSLECDKSSNILTLFLNNISSAVKYGHREIAHHLVQIAIRKGGFGFHTLHKEALQEKELFSIAKPSLVSSRSISNCNITPIHCAAINPDEYYISTLLESHSDSYSVQDTEGWHPIHYAAVCESRGPLKYLISKGIPTLVKDKEGNTPLHLACLAGRVHNVELILSHEANNSGDKHSCIERQNKEGLTPLHIACEKGKEENVKILLESGADPEKVTLTGNDKLTPLMIASQNGHLGVVKMLVEKGVDVEALDRRDRTALLHAIINGHSHVVSFLLRLGANPNTKESFGNTAVHFAVAYGWYFTLKLLIDAGAKINEPNVCNITPLMIGYIKGHLGLVEMLANAGVTLDSQVLDSSGQTLLMETIKSRPGKSMIDRIMFLANHKVDFTQSDREGNNAFHYLADYGEYLVDEPDPANNDESEGDDFCSEDEEVAIKKQEFNHRKINRFKRKERLLNYLTQTIKLLRDNKCDYAACNNLKETCFHKAAKYGYFDLIEALIKSDCKLSESINEDDNTLLHLIVRHTPKRCSQLLPSLKNNEDAIKRLTNMMKVQNRSGEVPLASVLLNYKSLDKDEQEVNLIDFMVNTLQADVRINVPLDNIKTETCINFVIKYCTPEIVSIIQKRLDFLNKNSPLPPTPTPVPPPPPSSSAPVTTNSSTPSTTTSTTVAVTSPSKIVTTSSNVTQVISAVTPVLSNSTTPTAVTNLTPTTNSKQISAPSTEVNISPPSVVKTSPPKITVATTSNVTTITTAATTVLSNSTASTSPVIVSTTINPASTTNSKQVSTPTTELSASPPSNAKNSSPKTTVATTTVVTSVNSTATTVISNSTASTPPITASIATNSPTTPTLTTNSKQNSSPATELSVSPSNVKTSAPKQVAPPVPTNSDSVAQPLSSDTPTLSVPAENGSTKG